MSEKAACPRCDAYASEVWYEGRHSWCGWNCNVEYVVTAFGPTGHASLTTKGKPSEEQGRAVAALVGADTAEVRAYVDGSVANWLSPWLDPERDTPQPLSERAQKANLKALKAKRRREALAAIDDEFDDVT